MMKLAVLHAWLMVSPTLLVSADIPGIRTSFIAWGLVSSCLMVTTTALLNVANTTCGTVYPDPSFIGRHEPNSRQPRILNGTDAYRGQFPWLVSIKVGGNVGGHFCGGALIHERLVLTAAHCFTESIKRQAKEYVKVVIGEHTIREKDANEESLDVIKVITHMNHTKRYINDIALIVLKNDILWTKLVQPLCLPDEALESEFDEVNWTTEAVRVAGWGYTAELGGDFPDVLQHVELAVVPRAKCENWFTEKVGKPVKIFDTHYCAGYYDGHKDTCGGDGGGPLLLKDEATGNQMVIGITSAGIGCGREGMPGIYTRVARYIPWILKHKEAIKDMV